MRREKDVMAEILDRANLEEAFKRVLAGRKRKRSFQGRGMVARKEAVLDDIARRLADGSFRPGGYHEREIVECGKVRKLQVLSLYDRVAVHAVMAVVDRRLKKRFVRTTAASIEGRGTHDLLNYMAADLNADPEGTAYCYKFDIRKFYESVSQERLMECVQKVFKDKTLVALLDGFVRMLPSGVSIGLRSSQGLCNLYLSHYLDHELKDKLGVRHYYRYCDDGVVLGKSKAELWKIRGVVHRQVERAGLEVKPNERVFPVGEGIDFLGYVLRDGEDIRLRKRVKQKFARKTGGAKAVKSRKRRRELTASFYGMAKHARCNNLFYALTGRKMKSFKDLNVSYKPEDGKKRFPGTVVSIRELVNLPIIVKDFETGIKTEQGEDRCIVAIEVNGEARKFFTNSEEMKNILQQIREVPDGFPFETIIKTESFGKGRTKYVFT